MVNDAFNITDPFTASVQHQTPDHTPAAATLKKPPKWLRRPCGASFGVRVILDLFPGSPPDVNFFLSFNNYLNLFVGCILSYFNMYLHCSTQYLWCYSEFISTPGKLKNMPDYDGNETYDLC